jgi:aryl-alcohol dehydrogenase-like predicted oxidoreductase
MEYRPLGSTGQRSSVAILGGCAFGDGDVEATRDALELALRAGVNHLDIAPSYGDAELAVGTVLPPLRSQLFVACKTMERSAEGARRELECSLARLYLDYVDLYQFHAVTSDEELEAILAPGGAAEAVLRARDEGLVRHVGITGHFLEAPRVFARALAALPLETIMLPLGVGHFVDAHYRRSAEALLAEAEARGVGVIAIKALARRPWGERPHRYGTWYEPLDEPSRVQAAVDFVLSLPITGFATPCDRQLLPLALRAAENASPLAPEDAEARLAARDLVPLGRNGGL